MIIFSNYPNMSHWGWSISDLEEMEVMKCGVIDRPAEYNEMMSSYKFFRIEVANKVEKFRDQIDLILSNKIPFSSLGTGKDGDINEESSYCAGILQSVAGNLGVDWEKKEYIVPKKSVYYVNSNNRDDIEKIIKESFVFKNGCEKGIRLPAVRSLCLALNFKKQGGLICQKK